MPVPEIIQEVERSLDMLGAGEANVSARPLRDLPERQRSMRAVFDATFGLLTNAEQAAFVRLSIFRGGFTREAAAKIAGATLPILAGLIDRGLVQNRRNGIGPRYDLHELTRQYATDRLSADKLSTDKLSTDKLSTDRHLGNYARTHEGGAPEALAEAHARYFAAYAAQFAAMAFSAQYRAASYAFSADLENLRAAWQVLVAHVRRGDSSDALLESLTKFAPVLVWFYTTKAYYQEGLQAFEGLLEAMEAAGWETTDASAVDVQVAAARRWMAARSKMHHAIFLFRLGHFVEADKALRQVLPLLRRMPAGDEGIGDIAQALSALATVTLRRGSRTEAEQYARESIALYTRIGNDLGRADSLATLGLTQTHAGEYAAAQESLVEALAVFERHNYAPGMARCLLNLGTTYSRQHQYDEALPLYERSLAMSEAEGLRALVMINTSNIAAVHSGKGRYLLAETNYKRSLNMAREMGEQRWIAANLNGMSKNYLDMGDMQAAYAGAREALEVGIEHHAFTDALGSLGFIAHVWARQGRVQDALRLLLFVEHHASTPERDLRFNAPLLADPEAWGAVKTLEEVAAWTLAERAA
jgi:tetratricopeptide (TPR) repeat protein